MRVHLWVLILLPCLAAIPAPARAATFFWGNAQGGDWPVSQNWNSASYPRFVWDFAFFTAPGAYDVYALDPSRVASVGGLQVEGSTVRLHAHAALVAGVSVGISGAPSELALLAGGIGSSVIHTVGGSGTLTLHPGTALRSSASGAIGVSVAAGGLLRGDGAILDGRVIRCLGSLSPGLSPGDPGLLTIGPAAGAGLELRPSSAVVMELGGTIPGADHDHLRVTGGGPVLLDGTLHVELLPGYVPADGDRFDLLVAPAYTGAFAAVELPALPGVTFSLVYDADRVSAVAAVAALDVTVALDVRPGSDSNPFSMKSRGVVPAAIAGGGAVDLATVDPVSLALAGVPALRVEWDDVTSPAAGCGVSAEPDGVLDLVFKVDAEALAAALGPVSAGDSVPAPLEGMLLDGTPLHGEDCLTIVGNPAAPAGKDRKPADAAVEARPGIRVLAASRGEVRWEVSGAAGDIASLAVFDVRGRQVAEPWRGSIPGGAFAIAWRPAGVASGVYFARWSTAQGAASARVAVTR